MRRQVPGTYFVEGREVFYIEIRDREGFDEIADGAFAGIGASSMPQFGGIMEEKAWIHLADGKTLLGVSYRGDLERFRAMLIAFAEATGRMWGVAYDGVLHVRNETELVLSECDVELK